MPLPCLLLLAAPVQSPAAAGQFDFWIGDWEVRTPDGKPAGANRIEALMGGALLQEHWTGAKGGAGTSLNFVDRTTGKWRQIWVDSKGGTLDLRGGLQEGRMVLEGETPTPKGPQRERITWTPRPDGSVRQLWEQSMDRGATWSVAFDGIYTKRN